MTLLSRLVLSALIASAASLHAQDAAQNHASPSSPAPALCDSDSFEPGSPLEVLSDTSSVDLRQYLWDVTRKIRISWHKAIPADARSSSSNKGCATVEFSIEKDGNLAGMKLVQSSGDAALEQAAQAGITTSAPFVPLPEQFTGDSLALRFHFRYNPQRGHLMPVGPHGGEWHSTAAGDNARSGSGAVEAKTYQGEPVYRVGAGVTAPKATYMPNPDYTEQARKKKLQGTVVLEMVVTREGNTDDVKVVRGLDSGLDQKAIDTVRRWKFDPGTRAGEPVTVQLTVEVSFRMS
jgi:TonB family protein